MKTTVLTTFAALAIVAVLFSYGVHRSLGGLDHIEIVSSR